jgi:TP901 family phage tail tape measure protein
MADARLQVLIEAKNTGKQAYKNAQRDIEAVAESARKLGRNLALAGGAATAAFGFAVKSASSFEKGMAEVNTLINLSEDQLKDLSDGTRKLAREMGIDAVDATSALYQAISAGQKPADVLEFLGIAAESSIGGVTDLETSVDGLTTILNAFGMESSETTRVADIMFATVRGGKTTMTELAGAMFQVAPIAAAAGVSLEEIAAATATVTKQGTVTKVAMTGLRQLLVSMMKPTTVMSELLSGMGFESGQAALDALGLVGALDAVRTATDGNVEAFATAIGSVEALTPALQLTGPNLVKFKADLDDVTNATGASHAAFVVMQETSARQFAIMKAHFTDLKIEIGDALIPAIISIANALRPIIEAVTNFASENKLLVQIIAGVSVGLLALGLIIGGIGLVMGPLIGAVVALAAAYSAAAISGGVLAGVMAVLKGPVGIIALVAVSIAAAVAVKKLTSRLDESAKAGEEASDAVKGLGAEVKIYTSAAIAAVVPTEDFGVALDEAFDQFHEGTLTLTEYMEIMKKVSPETERLIKQIQNFGKSHGRAGDFIVEATRHLTAFYGLTDEQLTTKTRNMNDFRTSLQEARLEMGRTRVGARLLATTFTEILVPETVRNFRDFRGVMFEARREVQELQVGAMAMGSAFSIVASTVGRVTVNVHSMISALEMNTRTAQNAQVGAMLVEKSISKVGAAASKAAQEVLTLNAILNAVDITDLDKIMAQGQRMLEEHFANLPPTEVIGALPIRPDEPIFFGHDPWGEMTPSEIEAWRSGGAGDLLSAAKGGVVPGRSGEAQLAIVHGGEMVIPTGGMRGGGDTFIFQGDIYGFNDFEERVSAAVRDRKSRGGFDGVLN